MKRYEIREHMNSIVEPPGKTWFWELASAVIDAERCVQCGVCVAVCPSNSIGVNAETGLPELVKMCTGCSLCWDFCPRGGLRHEATWLPATPEPDEVVGEGEIVTRPDPADSYWTITGVDPGRGLGRVTTRYAMRASQSVEGAQDGGAVTALLAGLLRAGAIDGALVSAPSTNPDELWKGVATIATTVAELRAAAGSFYNQTMALAELDLSRYDLPPRPRLALVGTPCEVEGLRALQLRRWPTGAHRIEAVTLTIALMCTKSFNYERLILDELERERKVDLSRVSKVDVTRGRLIVTYRDGAIAVDEPIKSFHGARLKGCDECADFLGRGADISVGSVGSADDWTTVLIRTPRGQEAVERARGALDLRDLDDAEALLRLDALDRAIAERSLPRPLDPSGPMFIEFDEHVKQFTGTDRSPVVIRR